MWKGQELENKTYSHLKMMDVRIGLQTVSWLEVILLPLTSHQEGG